MSNKDTGLSDGKELMKFVARTIIGNHMKKHSRGSKAYNALRDARKAIMESDGKLIVCKSTLSDNYPTENEL